MSGEKYRQVAVAPEATYQFDTSRSLAARMDFDAAVIEALPDRAVESSAGTGGESNARSFDVYGFAFLARPSMTTIRYVVPKAGWPSDR
jgi:hypothetical protein